MLVTGQAADAQGRERIGYGWLATNDIFGDLHDRWQTGSVATSRIWGRGWDGHLPQGFGEVLELRFNGRIVSPQNLNRPAPGDRPLRVHEALGAWTVPGGQPGGAAVDSRRIAQQGGAAIVAIDGLGRAAEIEIDTRGAQPQGLAGIGGKRLRIGTEQLQMDRYAIGCRHLRRQQFRAVLVKDTRRQSRVHHAHEFCYRPVDAAAGGEEFARHGVDHAFHGR